MEAAQAAEVCEVFIVNFIRTLIFGPLVIPEACLQGNK